MICLSPFPIKLIKLIFTNAFLVGFMIFKEIHITHHDKHSTNSFIAQL